jgi:hypothetical protein
MFAAASSAASNISHQSDLDSMAEIPIVLRTTGA